MQFQFSEPVWWLITAYHSRHRELDVGSCMFVIRTYKLKQTHRERERERGREREREREREENKKTIAYGYSIIILYSII